MSTIHAKFIKWAKEFNDAYSIELLDHYVQSGEYPQEFLDELAEGDLK